MKGDLREAHKPVGVTFARVGSPRMLTIWVTPEEKRGFRWCVCEGGAGNGPGVPLYCSTSRTFEAAQRAGLRWMRRELAKTNPWEVALREFGRLNKFFEDHQPRTRTRTLKELFEGAPAPKRKRRR